jgi:DNA-binding transcriptional LysR family regulator
MVNLKLIEAFVSVADLGTFRRAAERLNTTQPNISTRIAQLEHLLGVSLMERDAGSVRLTLKGQALLAPARAVLGAVDAMLAAVGDDRLFSGVLRLGVSEMVAHTWLRDFLIAMKAQFPGLDVELTVDLSVNLSRALFARDLDLVFQSGPFDRPARGSVALGRSPYAWVAAPSLGLATGDVLTETLLTHPILTHARGTVPFQQLEAHFRGLGRKARLVPSSNLAACLQMALDGLGIACLPLPMVAPMLEAGRLQRLAHDWRPDDLRFEARYLADPVPSYVQAAAEIARRLSPAEDAES